MSSFNKKTQTTSFHNQFLFLFLICLTQFSLAHHGCHQEEKKALLDFKSSLEDPSYRLSSWQEGSKYYNCCDWHGIQCSSDSFHVISINLRNTEYEIALDQYNRFEIFTLPKTALQGKFSPSIFSLTHLQYLDLAFNNFQESVIPLEFSTLTKLTHLDLSKSNFSGSILTQLTNLSSLKYLDLSCENYYCIDLPSTKWLRGLVNLHQLKLSGIDIFDGELLSQDKFSEHTSFLSKLKVLDLSNCGITGSVFPIQKFDNLSRLSSLNMSKNYRLNSPFPVHLENLTSLSILNLEYCNLSGSVPYMPQLKELRVYWNTYLHLDLATMFKRKWTELKYLRISSTKVIGPFLNLISSVPLLEKLYASGCSIQGPIPKSICKLSFLRDLYLDSNNFTGTIPDCITMLRYLDWLDLSNNSIGGNISLPAFIRKLNPAFLSLSSNNLTIATDQNLHHYPKPKLKALYLRACNLSGLFPTFICNLTHLKALSLTDNNLTGTIPCFYKLKNLRYLDLAYNNLHGPLPLLYQDAIIYRLEHNKFNGEISVELGKRLSTALLVSLSGNELTGSIPFSICSRKPELNFIQEIDLSDNNLSGIIPTSIGYCKSLRSLKLDTNKLTGNVPNELAEAINLEMLQLNDNNLNGDPLYIISKIQGLRVLILGNNNFGGSISGVFGTLRSLKILSLRLNKFSGSITKEIVGLDQLQILDLSGNNLAGFIPREIGNLTTLTSRSNDTFSLMFVDTVEMVSKGIKQFEKLYGYSPGIDISSNILEGKIPEAIGLLKGLSKLNLSHNRLSGNIPMSVGSMNGLESLDLSFNNFSGLIPVSLASMDFLGYLNLSYNNLSGIIPRGLHIDTLSGDGSAYVNNSFLCGYLTKNTCKDDQRSDTDSTKFPDEDGPDDSRDKWYFYGVVASGFIVGFWSLFFGFTFEEREMVVCVLESC